jgi:hypothetical protein
VVSEVGLKMDLALQAILGQSNSRVSAKTNWQLAKKYLKAKCHQGWPERIRGKNNGYARQTVDGRHGSC